MIRLRQQAERSRWPAGAQDGGGSTRAMGPVRVMGQIDFVCAILQGEQGSDGILQGYFQMLPYFLHIFSLSRSESEFFLQVIMQMVLRVVASWWGGWVYK